MKFSSLNLDLKPFSKRSNPAGSVLECLLSLPQSNTHVCDNLIASSSSVGYLISKFFAEAAVRACDEHKMGNKSGKSQEAPDLDTPVRLLVGIDSPSQAVPIVWLINFLVSVYYPATGQN